MNIALIDDEKKFLDILHNTLEDALKDTCVDDYKIDRFDTAEDFMENFIPEYYQLIFLDIFIDKANGIDVAKFIREQDTITTVVLCSTSNDFASESYEVNANYYLKKPISKKIILNMLKQIDISKIHRNQLLTLPDGSKHLLYKIEYTQHSKHHTYIYFDKSNRLDEYVIYMNHKDLEDLLICHSGFISINRGTIVNLNMVETITNNQVVLKSGTTLPIARNRVKDVNKEYINFSLEKMKDRFV